MQSITISASLFNLLAEALMRRALDGYNKGFKIGGKTINNVYLRYADDIVLIATSIKDLQELVGRLEQAGQEYNMLINSTKQKY